MCSCNKANYDQSENVIMTNLDSKIRKLKLELMENLDNDFKPKNIELDERLEKELSKLYKERSKVQKTKIDTLGNMYLKAYH